MVMVGGAVMGVRLAVVGGAVMVWGCCLAQARLGVKLSHPVMLSLF